MNLTKPISYHILPHQTLLTFCEMNRVYSFIYRCFMRE